MSALVEALAEVQAGLPTVVKGETAEVPTKAGGKYSYSYADLADISEALFALLPRHGLAFTACPTLREDGQFVLRYALMHVDGEERGGDYPLPLQGGPQAQGSAITYARRYTLCAVTGVAPEDDDGQAAQRAATEAAPDPKSGLDDELASLDTLIAEAKAAGVSGDFDATRQWAAESTANAKAAQAKIRKATVEGASDG